MLVLLMLPMLFLEQLSTPLRLEYSIEVARGDTTMLEIAAAFSRVLGKTVQYQQIPFEAFEQQIGEELTITFSRVLGKTVQYQQIPFEAFEQQIGEELTIMYRWFENVGYAADLVQLKRDFPAQTNFESYLRDHDWQNQPEARLMSGR
ncbi:hypothetical protein [Trichocoleus sp. ST-U2]|uniref:NmrA family NAD(P)-binding protein n=3 Tax=Cyanophyceae TaxID=3028117 RepID=UPI00329727AE